MDPHDLRALNFYLTPSQACSYLPGQEASSLIADPRVRINTPTYAKLIDHGFRRSGNHVYRPLCPACDACIPVRLPVAEFQPNRNQKRNWLRNHDLAVNRVDVAYNEEHFELYQRYLAHRHSGGGMDPSSPDQYLTFITSSAIDTALHEFRLGERLLAVAVVDHLPQGLSAVYTFFEPAEQARGLGNYAVLWEIYEAERLGLSWLYLGYWIKECRKMSYKGQYRPLEMYRNGAWLRLDT